MNPASQDRRQFFVGLLRGATLGTLGAGGGLAVLKRRRLLREGKCINQSICKGCDIFDDCGLPRALSVRRAQERGRHV